MPVDGQDRDAIQSLPLFSDLSPNCAARLLEFSTSYNVREKTVVFRVGEPAEHVYVLLSGFIGSMVRDRRGNDYAVDFTMAGGCFALAAAILDRPYAFTAQALQNSRLVRTDAGIFRECVRSDPNFAVAAVKQLSLYRSAAMLRLQDVMVRSPAARIATFLLRLSDDAGGAARITLPCDRRILAGWLGVVPATAARAFLELAKLNMVETRGRQVTIKSPDQLRRLADS